MNDTPRTDRRLAAALTYAGAGRSVFPVKANKQPWTDVCPNGFHDATTDADTIRKWWRRHPNAGIGMVPLPGELVLDVETEAGHGQGNDGTAEYDRLCEALGAPESQPMASTTNGGMHVWGTVPEGLEFTNGHHPHPGLEMRTHRGYVVVPVSRGCDWLTAPLNGRATAWPTAWVRWFTDNAAESNSLARDTKPSGTADGRRPNAKRLRDYVRKSVDAELDELARRPEGERNRELNNVALRCARLMLNEPTWNSREWLETNLFQACELNGHARDSQGRTARKTISSAFGKADREGPAALPADIYDESESASLSVEFDGTEPVSAPTTLNVEHLERGFWESRASLKLIYEAALNRMASPWAVLGCCAAKALTLAPPNIVLPDIIGGPGSLNWFVALAAESGGGKGAAMDTMDAIIKDTVRQANIGSGEGMIEAYRGPKDPETGEPTTHAAIQFEADEIDQLAAMAKRQGATVFSMLRSAFSGKRLGASTKASNGFHLPAHSYRLTLIVGAQPQRASVILDDVHGGTPQRFMWFPATDTRISEDVPPWPGELRLPNTISSDKFAYGAALIIPDVAVQAIRVARVKSQRGDGNPLDSHRLYVREKFAYALAILDGRDTMNGQDWELSSVAMEVSDHVRTWITAQRERDEIAQAEQQGRTAGIRRAAADAEQTYRESQRRNRIARKLIEHLTAAGVEGMTHRALLKLFDNRTRDLASHALIQLESDGVVVKAERREGDRSDTKRLRVADEGEEF